MCYEVSSTKKKEVIETYAKTPFAIPFEYEPYYHKSGYSYSTLQIIKMDEPQAIYPAYWGLIPDWGLKDLKGFRKKYNTLNTKSETLFSGLSKGGANDKRCLIIADGFFEPHKEQGISIPYYCYLPSTNYNDGRDLFCFAGIYSELDEDAQTYSCSLLTTDANDFFAEIHNVKKRMPLVLDEDLKNEWLLEGLNQKQVEELTKNGFTSKEFKAHPVSRDLYKRGVDTNRAYILEEVRGER